MRNFQNMGSKYGKMGQEENKIHIKLKEEIRKGKWEGKEKGKLPSSTVSQFWKPWDRCLSSNLLRREQVLLPTAQKHQWIYCSKRKTTAWGLMQTFVTLGALCSRTELTSGHGGHSPYAEVLMCDCVPVFSSVERVEMLISCRSSSVSVWKRRMEEPSENAIHTPPPAHAMCATLTIGSGWTSNFCKRINNSALKCSQPHYFQITLFIPHVSNPKRTGQIWCTTSFYLARKSMQTIIYLTFLQNVLHQKVAIYFSCDLCKILEVLLGWFINKWINEYRIGQKVQIIPNLQFYILLSYRNFSISG